MAKFLRASALMVLLLILGSATGFAQFLSGIDGTVRDGSGAIVAGARVTITDNHLQVSKTTTTNDIGYFRIDSIAASTYTIRVEAQGFKTWEQNGFDVAAGQRQTIAPVMQVGSVSEQVTVSGEANAVNLATPGTTAVIDQVTVTQTPLSGQNIYGVAPLTPGITGAAVASGSADNFTNEYAVNINAAGLRQEQNGFAIDGAQTNTPSRGGGTSISPNPAIVQSMEVRTNDFDAQKGRNGGAVVDVYTKSGTDQLHGSIDYVFTNDALTTATHFEQKVPTFKHNDVSATLGGPAIKNKLFWFGSIEVLRSNQTGSGSATVETQDLVNWEKANLPNTVALQALNMAPPLSFPTTGLQTANNVLTNNGGFLTSIPAGMDPNMNVLGSINFATSSPKNGYQWSARGDYYKSDKDRFYVDVIRTNYNQGGTNPRAAFAAPSEGRATFANVNWTHTFSPRFLNEAGINIIRPYGQNGSTPGFAVPNVNVGGGVAGFGGWGPGNFSQQTVGWRDVATAMVKSHTLKFGFEQLNVREADTQGGAFDRPTFNFDNILDFIQDQAHSEGGTPVDLATHGEAPYHRVYRELYTGFFIQDDWKVRPTFTLNAGLRYDMMNNLFSIYSPTLSKFNLGPGATLQDQVAAGKVGLSPNSHVLDHSPYGLTPRIGFNWDVFGKGKTALRGGFGMFADQPPYLHITDMAAGNAPHFIFPSLQAQQGSPNPINFQLCQAPQGFTISCPVLDTSNATIDPNTGGVLINGVVSPSNQGGWSPDYKMTQVLAWSLSVQQQLPKSLVLEVNYSATEAHHLPIFNNDVNRFSGDLALNGGTFTRSNANFGTVQYATSDGNSVGHYGSAVLSRRFASGLSFRGIYTYGKSLDDISTALTLDQGQSTAGNSTIVTNGNLGGQRGRSDFDVRQQFALNFNYVTPSHYSAAATRQLLGGWEVSGMWIMQTGMPFWVYTTNSYGHGGDFNADGINWDSPNAPTFGSHLGGQSTSKFLNGLFPASAFPLPTFTAGTWGEGSLGRNTYDNPGYNNFNLTVGKAFTTPWFSGERMKLEARGEFFNLFNRVNLVNVDGNLADAGGNFGKATNQLPGRTVQLHFRATF